MWCRCSGNTLSLLCCPCVCPQKGVCARTSYVQQEVLDRTAVKGTSHHASMSLQWLVGCRGLKCHCRPLLPLLLLTAGSGPIPGQPLAAVSSSVRCSMEHLGLTACPPKFLPPDEGALAMGSACNLSDFVIPVSAPQPTFAWAANWNPAPEGGGASRGTA